MKVLDDITDNPVLQRELDVRITNPRTAFTIMIWLGMTSAVFVLAYFGLRSGAGAIFSAGIIGRQLFEWTLSMMLGLVLLFVPILTSSAIVGERERQTLASLQLTLLSPISIVLAKIGASVAFIVLLVILTMPLMGATLLVGGVEFTTILVGVGLTVFTAIVVGAIGVAASAVASRAQTAIVMSLGIVALFVVGTTVFTGGYAIYDGSRGVDRIDPPRTALLLNPFVAVADITTPSDEATIDTRFYNSTPNPLSGARAVLIELEANRARPTFDAPVPANATRTRAWRWYVAIMTVVAVISVGIAAEKVRAPATRER